MGTGLTLEGQTFPGGIHYGNLEALNIELGSGNDSFTVESTHAGRTSITTGEGDDLVRVKTIGGHTEIDTGDGDDTVRVSNDERLVDQITGLLTLDTGAGTDTVTVDDSPRHERQRRRPDRLDAHRARHADGARGADALRPRRERQLRRRAPATRRRRSTTTPTSPSVTTALKPLFGHAEPDRDRDALERRRPLPDHVPARGRRARLAAPRRHRHRAASSRTPTRRCWRRPSASRPARRRPQRTTVQTLTVDATGGTFVLHFLRPNRDGVLVDVATAPIDFDATADDLLLPLNCPAGTLVCTLGPLSAALNPNNSNPALPFTDNIRGDEARQRRSRSSSRARIAIRCDRLRRRERARRHARSSRRASNGIDYYGVETLNITLGSGNDVFNVQGTSAVTNLDLGAGDERIYVSSQANVRPRRPPGLPAGDLDGILGALNIDAGTGRHHADDQRRGERERRHGAHLRHGAERR